MEDGARARQIILGAEARTIIEEDEVIKTRLPKKYRIKEIDDKLTRRRVRIESKILKKMAEAGLNAPRLIRVSDSSIHMTRIPGIPLRDALTDENQTILLKETGKIVAQMHAIGIVHGDLTTMNFILSDEEIYVIDFGLSFFSHQEEDKAVDLYVFEKALKCVHSDAYLSSFYEGYEEIGGEAVMQKLKIVRLRGRKRE